MQRIVYGLLFFFLCTPDGLACSFFQPEQFLPTPLPWAKAAKPKPPIVQEISVSRGYKADPSDSCADTGVVVVKLAQRRGSDTGFTFRVVEGEADDQIFPDTPLFNETGVYVFPWIDGARERQEPLQLRVHVFAVNRDGDQSRPTEFQVVHDGKSEPNKP